MLSNIWEKIKKYFSDSEVIFFARLTTLTGFLTAVAAGLNWSPLLGVGLATGLSWRQAMSFGGVMILQGVITEWLRRRRATDLTS